MMDIRASSLLLLAAVGLVLVAVSSVSSNQPQVAQPEPKLPAGVTARQSFKLPKIFDFQVYKKLFKRAYHGLEESVRRKYMLARAFRAWISSLKYKYRKSSFYLAVNEFSDKSPEEMAKMENRHIKADKKAKLDKNVGQADIPEVDPNEIEQNLARLTSGQVAGMEGLKLLQKELKQKRKRRDLREAEEVRNFDINRLLSAGGDKTLDPETSKKVDRHPASNNPAYEAPELMSSAARTDIEEIRTFVLRLPEKDDERDPTGHSFYSRVSGYLVGSDDDDHGQSKRQKLPDEVFFDHRNSSCMFLPRSQSDCGSCYAFTSVALAEWLYCQQTGKLVAFSEQYLVDCGTPRLFYGCDGGNRFQAANFFHNYGVELLSNYPYTARQDECPYDDDTDPKTMGYIRMELGAAMEIPLERFEEVIEFGPMYVAVDTRYGLCEYGGGVMTTTCKEPDGSHAMLLIGHGREDGHEYWLLRNSYGPDWGERGHFKLAKEAEDCIEPRHGALYGTNNVMDFFFEPKQNELNDQSQVNAHYAKKTREMIGSWWPW